MSEDSSFEDLVRKVRKGEEAAAAELVRRYEPHIRRAVRVRLLRYPHMRRVLDSMDVCQSVMGIFFARAARGEYRLERPSELQNLLVVMAYHKLIDQVRKKQLADPGPDGLPEPMDPADSPSQQVMYGELLQLFRDRLDENERRLVDLKAEGLTWQEIAERVGGSPEALRKKLDRAVQRVARSLGIAEENDDD